jgi:hypothetical protein
MIIENYLQKIQAKETSAAAGIVGIDSPSVRRVKKKKIIRVNYPNENISSNLSFKRAMIDLDGTIHKYSKGFQDGSIYDEPFKGARETINWLRNLGYEIVIFTTRACEEANNEFGQDQATQVQNVKNWLSDNNIYFDKVTGEKLAADFYIDDKAIHIDNGDWKKVKKEIEKRFGE